MCESERTCVLLCLEKVRCELKHRYDIIFGHGEDCERTNIFTQSEERQIISFCPFSSHIRVFSLVDLSVTKKQQLSKCCETAYSRRATSESMAEVIVDEGASPNLYDGSISRSSNNNLSSAATSSSSSPMNRVISQNFHRRFASVQEFVSELGGAHKRVIEKVLIANNGVAAVKAIRSIRKWAYDVFGNERAISFVVMATPEDLRCVLFTCYGLFCLVLCSL